MARILRQLSRILGAWYLVIKGGKPEAKARRKVCLTCDQRKFVVCGRCGCPLIALSQYKDGCELSKWPM